MSYIQNSTNYYDNCINAIANVLIANRAFLQVADIYNYKPDHLPVFPSIGIEWLNTNRERRTLGSNAFYSIDINCLIHYYICESDKLVKEEDIRKAAYRVEKVLNENTGLNGFCANLGSDIGRAAAVDIETKNGRIAAAIIQVTAHIQLLIDTGL